MRSQVLWGIALTVVGAVIAAIAIAGLPFLLISGVPLIAIGLALIVWRRREETIEAIRE
jgi:glucose dehydrogenase